MCVRLLLNSEMIDERQCWPTLRPPTASDAYGDIDRSPQWNVRRLDSLIATILERAAAHTAARCLQRRLSDRCPVPRHPRGLARGLLHVGDLGAAVLRR